MLVVLLPGTAEAAKVGADSTGIILAFLQEMPPWLAAVSEPRPS